MAYNIAPDTIVRRHPIRGVLWGTMLGCGIALHILIFGLAPFGNWPILAAPIGAGALFGGLWGRFGPVKALKGRIPAALRSSSAGRSQDDSPQARRAAQLAAARQAQADLQSYAQANADEAMCAALREAHADVVDSSSRRASPVAAPPRAAVDEPQPTQDLAPVGTTTADEAAAHTATPDTTTADEPAVDTATPDEPAADTATHDEPAVDTATPDEPAVDTATPDEPAADTGALLPDLPVETDVATEEPIHSTVRPPSPVEQAEQLADHPAAQVGSFEDLSAAAAALANELDAEWEPHYSAAQGVE